MGSNPTPVIFLLLIQNTEIETKLQEGEISILKSKKRKRCRFLS